LPGVAHCIAYPVRALALAGTTWLSQAGEMSQSPNPHRGHRFPAEIIAHAVWLYHVFSLSLRDVELLLAARGVIVSYESVRRWCLKFGRSIADKLRQRRLRPGDTWHSTRCSSGLMASSMACGVTEWRNARPAGGPASDQPLSKQPG
jgi:putative transposase